MAKNKKVTSDELIEALTDQRVRDVLSQLFSDQISTVLDAKMLTFTTTMDNITTEHRRLQSRCDKLTEDNKVLAQENKILRKDLSDLMEYTRRDDLVLYGIEQTSYAEASSAARSDSASQPSTGASNDATEETVVQLCRESLGISITRSDISVAHRLGVKGSGSASSRGPAPIIVRFVHRKTRDAVFRARKQLKSVRPGVYINEHLTPENALLFKQARLLVKQKKLLSAWTSNCSVFIKDSELPAARPIKVCKLLDLPQ